MTKHIRRGLVALGVIAMLGASGVGLTRSVSETAEAASIETHGPLHIEIGYAVQTVPNYLGSENAIRRIYSDGTEIWVFHTTDDPFNRNIRVQLYYNGHPYLYTDTNHTGTREYSFQVGNDLYKTAVTIINDSYLYDELEPEPEPEPEPVHEPEPEPESTPPPTSDSNVSSGSGSSGSSSASVGDEISEDGTESTNSGGSEQSSASRSHSERSSTTDSTQSPASSESNAGSSTTSPESTPQTTTKKDRSAAPNESTENDENSAPLDEDTTGGMIEQISDSNTDEDKGEAPVFRSSVKAVPLPLDIPSEQPANKDDDTAPMGTAVASSVQGMNDPDVSRQTGIVVVASTLLVLSFTLVMSFKRLNRNENKH